MYIYNQKEKNSIENLGFEFAVNQFKLNEHRFLNFNGLPSSFTELIIITTPNKIPMIRITFHTAEGCEFYAPYKGIKQIKDIMNLNSKDYRSLKDRLFNTHSYLNNI